MMTRFNSVPLPTMVRRPTMVLVMWRLVDDAAVGNDGVVNLRAVDLGAGQVARAA